MSFNVSMKKFRKPEIVCVEERDKFAVGRGKSNGETCRLSAICGIANQAKAGIFSFVYPPFDDW